VESNKIAAFVWKEDILFIDSSEHLHENLDKVLLSLQNEVSKRTPDKFFKFALNSVDSGACLNYTKPIAFPYNVNLSQQFPSLDIFIQDCHEALYEDSLLIYKLEKCNHLIDYACIYNRIRTFQLCDVIRYYTLWALDNFHLSPMHCRTISSFGIECAFAFTGAKIENIRDEKLLKWIIGGIKAGLSFSNVQKVTANNELIGNYDSSLPRSHIIELDINGAYAAGAYMNLCVGEFSWLSEEEIRNFDINNVEEEGSYSFILEVDMNCPTALMDYHNPLPPGVVRRKVNYAELSSFQKTKLERLVNVQHHQFTEEKLILDLHEKKNYIIYHKLLKLYVKKGMKISRIHKIFRFKSEPVLKTFIRKVTDVRKKAHRENNLLIKNMCKMMLNSVYGKFLSNTGNRKKVVVSTTRTESQYYTAKPSFADRSILSPTCTLIYLNRGTVYYPHNVINAFIIL